MNRSHAYVRVPRAHYNAAHRVLKMLAGYLSNMTQSLHAHEGGMMTTAELFEHANQCAELFKPKKRRSKK